MHTLEVIVSLVLAALMSGSVHLDGACRGAKPPCRGFEGVPQIISPLAWWVGHA